ncbi:tetratricopeptide repeat protein [Muricauda ruestringensis]|uniref:tetratricopeptide repeat protein n=1 Tax=Flagellimonas TaxID=444459 RepID=UPI001CD5C135|nr:MULTISPECIES: tetratricopeptide repeat protein [Allomuricauda]MCA0957600.1 tetratricopeptide repeat protein [Allomuricauda ruestringensis]USD24477.1 tetratricopeptide repeat protein [Allomuricauda aquimarina]
MKSKIITAVLSVMLLGACVDNPNVTEDIYLNTPDPTKSWVKGLERQLAITMNSVLINTEMVSDNYFNNYTLYSKVFDIPQIDYTDIDVNDLQQEIGRLREMATYGLETVAVADENVNQENIAYMHFCKGFAFLLGGENFVGLPMESLGAVSDWKTLLNGAIEEFEDAIDMATDANHINAFKMFQARAYYRLGDLTNAKNIAESLTADESFLFTIGFDGENGVVNEMQNATFTSMQNRFAPLPRLDYLDPKYYDQGTAVSDQKPISLAKAEEAFLILMEAYLAENNVASAKATALDLLDVVAARPVAQIDDSRELRNGTNRTDYPLTAVAVRADADSEFENDLVLDRQAGFIPVYTVSGTKVTIEDIEAASSVDEMLYLTYLLRQEIFISEGRRMNDLGIRFPVSQTEQLNNPNVDESFTQAVIPSFIPLNSGLDDFTVDETTGNVTVAFDMNKVIVNNKATADVVPFQ